MVRKFFYILFCGVVLLPGSGLAQIYHIDISGTIDLGLPPYIERVLRQAESANARAVLLEINTFGGRVDAATQIKDILLNTELPTLAYVNKRAISAGAFIALSCKKIGMAPGSSMGAATVVDQGGNKASEKNQSYFRAEMGATAEHNGRDRRIAEGMVDEDVEIEGLTEKGKLITLTAADAVKWKMADYVAPTLSAFLDSLGYGDEEIIYTEENTAETVVRFLTNPIISSLLLTFGFLGLFFEFQQPGWGIPGTVGLVCLILFFGSHFIISLASSFEIILFVVGVGLLLLELFVIPGFGITGIAGLIFIFASIFMSLIGEFETVTMPDLTSAGIRVISAFLVTIFVAIIAVRFLPRTGFWQRISLAEEQKHEAGYTVNVDYKKHVGKVGVAITPLRPSGVGQFGEERLDVVSEGGFIEVNTPIKIVRTEGYRLVVREHKPVTERSQAS